MISKLTPRFLQWKHQRLQRAFDRLCLVMTSTGQLFNVSEGLSLKTERSMSAKDASAKNIPLLILSRASYQERWEAFPIKSKTSLRKVLKNRAKSASELHFIGPFESGQRRVLSITVRDDVQPFFSRAWFVVPESLIIARAMAPGLREVAGIEDFFYVFKQPQGEWSSIRRSLVVRDKQSALLALGGSESGASSSLASSELYNEYRNGLKKLKVSDWLAAFRGNASDLEGSKLPWLTILAASFAAVLLYFSAASLYMSYQLDKRQQMLSSISSPLNESLNLRNQLADTRADVLVAAEYWVDPGYIRSFWTFYADIERRVTELTSLRAFGDTIRFSGQAESATTLLQLVMSLEYVDTAEFTTPVRSGRQGEQFSIQVQLRKDVIEPYANALVIDGLIELPEDRDAE